MIEFTHRLSSGLALVLVAALFIWARRAYDRGHPVRLGATLSVVFTITEALVGAALVLLELVAYNTSMARAAWMALHLANTFMLLAALTLTAYWASGGAHLRLRGRGATLWLLTGGLVAMLVLGVSGAITALGDTLFPAISLSEAVQQDFSPAAHLLIRLRIFHPIIAVFTGLYISTVARVLVGSRRLPGAGRLAAALTVLVVVQLIAGAVNVVLLAPVWMQLVHLLLADLIWIVLVLVAATHLAGRAPRPAASTLAQPAYPPAGGRSRAG
jgi:heme A synthase